MKHLKVNSIWPTFNLVLESAILLNHNCLSRTHCWWHSKGHKWQVTGRYVVYMLHCSVDSISGKVSPCKTIVHKLEHYDVKGKLLPLFWLESSLNNQTQQVVVEGEFSTPCMWNLIGCAPVFCTCPGPLLFLIWYFPKAYIKCSYIVNFDFFLIANIFEYIRAVTWQQIRNWLLANHNWLIK